MVLELQVNTRHTSTIPYEKDSGQPSRVSLCEAWSEACRGCRRLNVCEGLVGSTFPPPSRDNIGRILADAPAHTDTRLEVRHPFQPIRPAGNLCFFAHCASMSSSPVVPIHISRIVHLRPFFKRAMREPAD